MVYKALSVTDAVGIGSTLQSNIGTFESARSSCNRAALCTGFAYVDSVNKWRTFSGIFWEGAVGKVRVVGEAINSWIVEQDGNG